ncbi:MAG: mannose-6-phosphate isomerase, class I [Arachnia sp.]
MKRLYGVRQSYAWGSPDEIPAILGSTADGLPFAEYWLGTHVLGSATLNDGQRLGDYLSHHPETLGQASLETFGPQLPFLLKLLSARSPLSLQAHPSREQAEVGYAKESLLALPIDSPQRSFRDDWPKPEAIVAITPFDGLVGFRDPHETAAMFDALGLAETLSEVIGPLRERAATPALQQVFLRVLTLGDERHLVDEVVSAAVNHLDQPGRVGTFARTAVEIDEHFPGDPGILAALLLHRFHLEPGEALALQPGIMHSYLHGTAIEVMANSDNVLRGGLTAKHIDVDGLLDVVNFDPTPVQLVTPRGSDGVYLYPTSTPEFELWLVQPVMHNGTQLPRPDAGEVCLATSGNFVLSGDEQPLRLRQGEAAFVPAGESVSVTGDGQLFVASSGV